MPKTASKPQLTAVTALNPWCWAKTRLRRVQYRPALLEVFLVGAGLDLTPFGDPTIENR
jgi:hypothetical protein